MTNIVISKMAATYDPDDWVMGTDLSVVNAARVSFDKRAEWAVDADGNYVLAERDKNLIQYLARGCTKTDWAGYLARIAIGDELNTSAIIEDLMLMATHWVPFTHTAIKLRMKAPVPIRTQAFKSKVGFTESEESRRYINSVPELFVPDSFRERSVNKKQGSGLVHADSGQWRGIYTRHCEETIKIYLLMLEAGIAEEQARFILPQGVMVNWIWTGNLASYARYFNLRYAEDAQKESQELALQVGRIIEPRFPVSWKALTRDERAIDRLSKEENYKSDSILITNL